MEMTMNMVQEPKPPHKWEYVERGRGKIQVTPRIALLPYAYGDMDQEEAREMMKRGVRAVNNFDALVAAVRHALAIENSVTLGQERELRSSAKAIYEAALSSAEE